MANEKIVRIFMKFQFFYVFCRFFVNDFKWFYSTKTANKDDDEKSMGKLVGKES